MAPSKFDLMKDMDAVLREAERERAQLVAARRGGTGNRPAVLEARLAFNASRAVASAAGLALSS